MLKSCCLLLIGLIALCLGCQGKAESSDASPKKPFEPAVDDVTAARELLIRVLGEESIDDFRFERIKPTSEGHDVFEIAGSEDGKVVLRGNNGVAMASALNHYLKYFCNAHVAQTGEQIDLPEPLDAPEKLIRISSPYRYRYAYNYCTFSYTMAWWDWDRWQREIDWLALNGVNLPLMIVGQEAVWLETFKRFGLSKEDLDSFFVGPAFLAWAWMNNLDAHGGPLPQSWIDSHVELGQKILRRQRELGMTPILQAYAGHTPLAYKQAHPDVRIDRQRGWAAKIFPGIYQMDPTEEVFQEIGKTFIEVQTELFGTDHLYAADPFHEGDPPRREAGYLTKVSKAIFSAMTAADPQAVWMMQSWSLRSPLVLGTPKDRLIVLDLNSGDEPKHPDDAGEAFWGRGWVWGLLHNYGARTQMGYRLERLATVPPKLRKRQPNMLGIGAFPEGTLDNPIIYDLLFEMGWREEPVVLKDWVRNYTWRRYGNVPDSVAEAWSVLMDSVYKSGQVVDSLIAARPALEVKNAAPNGYVVAFRQQKELVEAWRLMLEGAEELADSDTYRFDLVNLGRQVLSNHAVWLHRRVVKAYQDGDREVFEKAVKDFTQLAKDLDELCGTREEFLLGKWIADARSWGTTPQEKDLYEYNARMLVTLWGPVDENGLFDYSWRDWSGLIRGYYLPRWEMFFDFLDENLGSEDPYTLEDEKQLEHFWRRPVLLASDFYRQLYDFEKQWAASTESDYASVPTGDAVEVSRKMFEKYRPDFDMMYDNR
jgi:alpha-N-acetylglucosaminidase